MTGYNFFVMFYGPQDEESYGTPTVGDSELDAAGLLRCPNVYLKPTGYVHLMAVPTAGGPHEGADVMEQTHRYALADNATSLTFSVKQRGRDVTVTATNQQQASEKAQIQVGAKVSILKIVELSGGGSKEYTEGETTTNGVQYQVPIGFPTSTSTTEARRDRHRGAPAPETLDLSGALRDTDSAGVTLISAAVANAFVDANRALLPITRDALSRLDPRILRTETLHR